MIIQQYLRNLIFAVYLALGMISCQANLNTTIRDAAKDGHIAAEEWQTIKDDAIAGGRRTAHLCASDAALCDFVRRTAAKEITFAEGIACNEAPKDGLPDEKVIVNVFIENSGSMDGYVQGNSEFKNAIYSYLSDIKLPTNQFSDTMNLFYINTKLIPFAPDIQDFIEKLNPTTFRQRGGSRGSSDLASLFKEIIQKSGGNQVAVLVSDCVFSPGKRADARDYLVNQGIGIKTVFAEKISQSHDLGTVVLQLTSNFNGKYYDFSDSSRAISAKRPYYIWIIGKEQHLSKLLRTVPFDKIKGGYNHYHGFFPAAEKSPECRVLTSDKVGRFEPDRNNPKNSIQGAKASDRGEQEGLFRFALGVNFDNLGIGHDYVEAPANYKVNNADYTVEIVALSPEEKNVNPTLKNFSHKLLLTTSSLKKETLEISLLRRMPPWVEATHTEDDRNMNGTQLTKTFGFKYLVEGVRDAYLSAAGSNQEAYCTFKVEIHL